MCTHAMPTFPLYVLHDFSWVQKDHACEAAIQMGWLASERLAKLAAVGQSPKPGCIAQFHVRPGLNYALEELDYSYSPPFTH